MSKRLRFGFFIGSQPASAPRLLSNRRTRCGLEDDPTIVQLGSGNVLMPGVIVVRMVKHEPRTILLGEMINGSPRITAFKEVPLDLCAPGVMAFNGGMPFRMIRNRSNTVHCQVSPGHGIVPCFAVVKFDGRTHFRHFVVGDIWRGPWLHSVIEQPRPDRPVRVRAVT